MYKEDWKEKDEKIYLLDIKKSLEGPLDTMVNGDDYFFLIY